MLPPFEDAERDYSRAVARERFLELVKEEAPEALDELAGLVPDGFDAVAADRLRRRIVTTSAAAYIDAEGPIAEALNGWAQRWHLGAPWCLEVALDTLYLWSLDPEARDARRWEVQDGGGSWEPRVMWSPVTEEPAEAAARVGLHKPERPSELRLRRLVRYQVVGEERAEIAGGKDSETRPAVTRDIKRAAELLGLPLRPPRTVGRPRKSRN